MVRVFGCDFGVWVEFVDSFFVWLIVDVIDDCCDIVMFVVGIMLLCQEKLCFIWLYLVSDIYVIIIWSNWCIKVWCDIDKLGSVVVVVKGMLYELVMQEKFKFVVFKVFDMLYVCEQEVEFGWVDVFMIDFFYSQCMLKIIDWVCLVKFDNVYYIIFYVYVVCFGDDCWYVCVEQFVVDVKCSGELKVVVE